MNKVIKLVLLLFLVVAVAATAFTFYMWRSLSNAPLNRVIVAAIDKDPTEKVPAWIPRGFAFWYLEKAGYSADIRVKGSSVPLLNFSLFAYSKRIPKNNQRVLKVAQLLINRGADINARDVKSGRTALHEAIMFNQHGLVGFLMRNKANPNIKVFQVQSKFHGTNAPEFARLIQKIDKNIDYSKIISMVEKYHAAYNKGKIAPGNNSTKERAQENTVK